MNDNSAAADAADSLSLLREQGALTDLDVHFARLMERLTGDIPGESGTGSGLQLAAALASHATGQGDVCVNLRQWARRWQASRTESASLAPPIGDWLEGLRASAVVGRPGQRQPLILDPRGRLYLYRYWGYEQQLAVDLLERAHAEVELADESRLQACLLYTSPSPRD